MYILILISFRTNTESNLHAEHSRIVEDHQRQLEHVQKSSEANVDRTRRRLEAEIGNLQSDVSKLESKLAKVRSQVVCCHGLTSYRQTKTMSRICRPHTMSIQLPSMSRLRV
jgi:hypothetical protein